jgi:hypothetical protein
MKMCGLISAGLLCLVVTSGAMAARKPFTLIAVQNSQAQDGKTFTFQETLSSGKKVVAHDSVKCLETSASTATCAGMFTFVAGGTITAKGKISFSASDPKIPITGGTGPYGGVKGELHLRDLSSTRTQLTFDLS